MKLKLLACCLLASCSVFADNHVDIENAVMAESRSEKNIARDKYRHPLETLEFMRIAADQTVVEIWPGGGWYTEILAPLLSEGTLIAAHFPKDTKVGYYQRSRSNFVTKMTSEPKVYGKVVLAELDPAKGLIGVADNSADRIVTFRNVHNWFRNGHEQDVFNTIALKLKPGGLLGVVEHRANPDATHDEMARSGYVTEAYVIELAKQAGLKLIDRSEINSNPKDTKDYEKGVWTLPPSLRLKDQDRAKYLEIGESDRMTLLFEKPSA